MDHEMTPADHDALIIATHQLETQSFAMQIATKVGMPVEAVMRFLPKPTQNVIHKAVTEALERCLKVALSTGNLGTATERNKRGHVAGTAVTGAIGGFFGLAGLAFELPVTTTIMLRSIATIARTQGEDLTTPEGALACLEVFALGPQGKQTEAIESAYYTTRAALTQVTREAVSHLAQRGLSREAGPAVMSFIGRIAARFGLEVSEKAAAQLIPFAGAAGGLTLNILFTQHFQRIAEGHFTVRRLERTYGQEMVREQYEALRAGSAVSS